MSLADRDLIRDHYVYRAFDEFGLLLYIGCTKQPEMRWKQHVSASAWTQYAQRFTLAGPFTRKKALSIEAAAIEAEEPHFNCSAEHKRSIVDNQRAERRLFAELKRTRPELFGVEPDSAEFEEFCRQCDRICAEAHAIAPRVDDEWRHAFYLNTVRDLQNVAA